MKKAPLRSVFLLLPVVAVFTLTGCATTKSFGKSLGLASEPASPYGDYLLARYASSEADVSAAAKYYMRALKKDPANNELRQRVLLSSVFASDVKQAAAQAKVILETNPDDRLARLILAANEIAEKQYADAVITLEGSKLGPLNQVIGGIIQAWALHGIGNTNSAITSLDDVAMAPVLGSFALFHKALILAQAGLEEQADAAFDDAMSRGLLTSRTAYGWASVQLARGNKSEALKLLNSRLNYNKYEIEARYLLAQAQSDKRIMPAFSTVREGAAEGFFGLGRAMAERSLHELAIIYLELALHIDPGHDAVRELLGRLYNVQNRTDDALRMFASIKKNQPWYLQAQLDLANTLFQANRREEGLASLLKLNEEAPQDRVKRALAAALQADKQYEAALKLYVELIDESPEEADDWRLYFARAVCLERIGKWREAVPYFRKSLELNPDQAEVLNYLGYTFVDNQENLEEGFELIKKAIALAPTAGYIVDSLGWGYYQLQRYEEAVTELEKAVQLEPAEPTINDHLGDAYWQVGRKLEARFQWQRVLSLEPDDEVDLEMVRSKIENGLPDVKAISVTVEN